MSFIEQVPLNTPIKELNLQLFKHEVTYKPFHYPWAEAFEEKQQSVHWVPREVPMGEDLKDWAPQSERLTEGERAFLLNIFRLFTQSDIDVGDNYMDNLLTTFRNGEVRRMLTVFSAFETIHIKAYSYVLESLKQPDSIYSEFLEHQAMRDKHDWLKQYRSDSLYDLLMTLACFGSFVEGLQLFASFAMLLNFPRFGLMKGMGQIVNWSIRDETIHVEGIQRLYHTLRIEAGVPSSALAPDLQAACRHFVMLEDAFIDKAFEFGNPRGITKQEVHDYVRYIADIRLAQLDVDPIYNITSNPLPWVDEQTGLEHANFFETRATEYSKAAHTGTWEKAWEALENYTDKQRERGELVNRPSDAIYRRQAEAGLVEPILL